MSPLWGFEFALNYFEPAEFCELNCGDYHDPYHAAYVAETVVSMAQRLGRDPDRLRFLAQVALIHDADPREVGTPAVVGGTLDWMSGTRHAICRRFGWDSADFHEAQALIARTDFPFDAAPRRDGGPFDGLSPEGVYRILLERLPESRRTVCMEDAQLLRFADQVANYCRDFETASAALDGLVREFQTAGREVDRSSLDTSGFLETVASDLMRDRRIALGFGITPRYFTRQSLTDLLSEFSAVSLASNRMRFAAERETTRRAS